MIPNRTKKEHLNGSFDYQSDTIRVALLKDSTEYDPDPDSHEFVNDVLDSGTTGAEFDGSNYSRKTMSNGSTSTDDSFDEGQFTGDAVTWQNLGGSQTVEAILVYKQVGGDDTTPGDDPILFVVDDSEVAYLPFDTNGKDFRFRPNPRGYLVIT